MMKRYSVTKIQQVPNQEELRKRQAAAQTKEKQPEKAVPVAKK